MPQTHAPGVISQCLAMQSCLPNESVLAISSGMSKKALITGITGQDGSYLAGVHLEQRLRGSRHYPWYQLVPCRRLDQSTLIRIPAAAVMRFIMGIYPTRAPWPG